MVAVESCHRGGGCFNQSSLVTLVMAMKWIWSVIILEINRILLMELIILQLILLNLLLKTV